MTVAIPRADEQQRPRCYWRDVRRPLARKNQGQVRMAWLSIPVASAWASWWASGWGLGCDRGGALGNDRGCAP